MKTNTHKKILGIILTIAGLMMFFGCGKPVSEWAQLNRDKNEKTGKWGFVYENKTVIKYKYDDAGDFSTGLAPVKINGKWGYIDRAGKDVIASMYDSAGVFIRDAGLAKVGLAGHYGLVDKTGKEIVPVKYDEIGDFAGKLIKVSLAGKWGFIDKTGREIIPVTYEKVGEFYRGLASVCLGGKYGYIDETGAVAIPLIYDAAANFSGDEAAVQQNGNNYLINRKGETLPYKKMLIEFVHQTSQTERGAHRVLIRDKLVFRDEASKELITFDKIMISGGTVTGMRSYTEAAPRKKDDFGPSVSTVAELSMDNGRSIKYYSHGPLAFPIQKKYTLENETLNILE